MPTAEDDLTSQELFDRTNAARDAQAGVGIVEDPYPRYHELQATCPAFEGTITGRFGFEGLDGALYPDRRHVSVMTYALVEQILKDTDTFSSSWYGAQLESSVGRSTLQMDPPE
ncbi:MAG: hypothetical protein KDB21_10205, partial [Acidimicrobiales bacterium]|nr:hypothetical protein [Acidimicrobiales bacterium]